MFSPTFLTEARIGVAHLGNQAQPNDYGTDDATKLGVPGVNIDGQPFTSGQVAMTINGGFSNPIIGYSASVPWIRAESNIDFVNNWTKISGNHTFKWGVDVRRVRDDLLQDQTFSPRGAFTFSDVQTSDASSPGTTVANDIASFLLDQPSQTGRDLNTFFPRYRQWWIFGFASDKWQATSKLTLDLGLRWDLYPPATPALSRGILQLRSGEQPTGAGRPGRQSLQPRNDDSLYNYFAPRTGFAYRVRNNTVIRGGFGISYTPFPDNTYAYNYPIRANNSYQPTGSSGFTPAVLADGVTVATFQAGFPAPVPVTIPSNGIIPANTPVPHQPGLRLHSKELQELPMRIHGMSLCSSPCRGISRFSLPMSPITEPISPARRTSTCPAPMAEAQSRLPSTPAFGRTAATNQYFLGFSSNYQSLQANLDKRFSHGLSLTSAFTWGKGLGYISGDDGGLTFFINWRRNYAPVDFDRALNFEQSFTYELPFGRGHQMLNSGVGDAVLGRMEDLRHHLRALRPALYDHCQRRHTEYSGNPADGHIG